MHIGIDQSRMSVKGEAGRPRSYLRLTPNAADSAVSVGLRYCQRFALVAGNLPSINIHAPSALISASPALSNMIQRKRATNDSPTARLSIAALYPSTLDGSPAPAVLWRGT